MSSLLFYTFLAFVFFYIGRNFDSIRSRLVETKTLNRANKVGKNCSKTLLWISTLSIKRCPRLGVMMMKSAVAYHSSRLVRLLKKST